MHMRETLLDVIKRNHQELLDLRGLPLRTKRQIEKRLQLAAEKHSFLMETGKKLKKKAIGKKSGRLKKEKTREISAAWLYLRGDLEENGFTEEAIKKTNFLIVPELYKDLDTAFYRCGDRGFTYGLSEDPVLAPREEKIEGLMKKLMIDLNAYAGREDYHPIEVAGLAHLALAYIHPFRDGNGRTARLVQDAYLDIHQFPVPIIWTDEKADYQAVLKNGMRSWRGEDNGRGISNFLNYIGTKVSESLRQVLGKK